MQGERLYFPFVIRVPFVFGVFVLNDPRRSAEVVKHIFVNLPHLNRVDGEGLAINLFYICEFLIVDNHSALIVRGKVVFGEAFPLLPYVLRRKHVSNTGKEPDRSRIFNAVYNALIVRMDQLHCWTQGAVVLSEKIV